METAIHFPHLDPKAVSMKAYEIWESMGRPEGMAEQTWLEAERQLRERAERTRKEAADTTSKNLPSSAVTMSRPSRDATIEPVVPSAKAVTHQTAPAVAAPVQTSSIPSTTEVADPPSAPDASPSSSPNHAAPKKGHRGHRKSGRR
ncbi:MAG: DUF2934 domain-containing protein [Polyangiaceae bacterium]